jgi:hypothetical protein
MSIRSLRQQGLVGVLALAGLVACGPKEPAGPDPAEASSFTLLQDRILTTQCATAGCHASAQDGTYAMHRLLLTPGVAYEQLVGVPPTQALANADGLLRVRAYQARQSLLYHKLFFDGGAHHAGTSYGAPMPLGGTPLTVGQVEFVRRWIEAGAPKTGQVVDETLLDDTTPSYVPTAFAPLPAPAPGMGFQLKIEPFPVSPNFERELFVRRSVGNTQDVYVNRIQLRSRPNSHHLVIYDFRNQNALPALNTLRDLRNPDGTLNPTTLAQMGNHVFLGGGTDPNLDYTLPDGAALLLPANATVDLNPHYFNRTAQALTGENYVNFHTVEKAQVRHVARTLDLGNSDLLIPPNTRRTFTKTWTFPQARTVILLTSHNHERGERFVIKIKGGARDGEVVYESTDWEHPAIKAFSPGLRLQAGEGLTSEITYYNPTDRTVRFGLTSQDEMGIIFGYYYE